LKQAKKTEGETDRGARDVRPWDTISLSPRQRQILSLLRAGKANKEIAHELGIGIGTVKQHLVTLFKKLGVSNRSMAISKSHAIEGLPIDGPVPLDAKTDGAPAAPSLLERRPVAVLSLEVLVTDGIASADLLRDLYRIYAEVAFDFGAVFLSHRGGRCDMIFGIRQVRRYDAPRALRAAVAVSEAMKSRHGDTVFIRGGLAYGYVFASTDSDGEWTGEAIGGTAIATARALVGRAQPGSVGLAPKAQATIADLGLDTSNGIPAIVPLNREFRWRRLMSPPPLALRGRIVEIQALRKRIMHLKSGNGGFSIIDGESGMGKTALAHVLAITANKESITNEAWLCAIPDSQPGSASLGRLERSDSHDVETVEDFCRRFAHPPADAPHLLIIEDAHLLPRDDLLQLIELGMRLNETSVLLAIVYRGRINADKHQIDAGSIIRPGHLPDDVATEIIEDHLGPGHPGTTWVRNMARGVPNFLTRLAAYVEHEDQVDGPGRVPTSELFVLVAERIEAHNLDRRLLYGVARHSKKIEIPALQEHWVGMTDEFEPTLKQAIEAGVLTLTRGRRGKPDSVEISHPLVKWVFSAAFASQDRAFG